MEEVLHFFFVAREGCWRDCDDIAVFVVALGGEFVDGVDGWEVEVEDSELGEFFWCYIAAGVVGLALVALVVRLESWREEGGGFGRRMYGQVVEPVCSHYGGGWVFCAVVFVGDYGVYFGGEVV